ncbi:MAG: preprotein translocase subunit SecA [Nitrospirae bacterium]|nr:preprotein translocase subunit SecA [Nitrospirota bacterium]
MFSTILKKILGTKNERELKRIQPLVDRINSLEPSVQPLSDEQLRGKTVEFRSRLQNGETLHDILPEAFAVCREASRRVLGMRHFDVQLIGGIVLHNGNIAEMKTGEGKTLVATLPVYLNALSGRGVHVVTVNDYLARRDAAWMGELYGFLGLSTGVIVHGLNDEQRQASYGADITYGTNNEFGFDYLRDNMKYNLEDYSQRELNFAIVDEVDSILIDEARTPLIISGPSEESTGKYYNTEKIVQKLRKDTDFTVEEKSKTAALTEEGVAHAEKLLGIENLFDPSNIDHVHCIIKGLVAHEMYRRDVDYVVNNGEVVIVDEFTGRLMPGRRWSDGLHQAIEAKEGLKIESENQTLATITFQNYFRMYNKLAGMTGTAATEAAEFEKIYNLETMVIPTHMPMIRKDNSDLIYRTKKGKFEAAINEIEACHKKGQPVLVGTISIENSEILSELLKRRKVPHAVLNAKQHEREAEIVMQAGRKGAVTIATNMAGRGTDIVLGGNPKALSKYMLKGNATDEERAEALRKAEELCAAEKKDVLAAGGLHILGTERHESRRIDNQLRGRSGRQGDPGSSRFYLSLEDDLMRIFGSDRIAGMMDKLGMDDSAPIEHKMVSKAIENAQKKVEAHHFDARKHLLEYDDVMNKQRLEIYGFRRDILSGASLGERVREMVDTNIDSLVEIYCPDDKHVEEWDLHGLKEAVYAQFDMHVEITAGKREAMADEISAILNKSYALKEEELGSDFMRYLERVISLQVIDTQWKDHLLGIDHLKEGIGLRGYGQRDPLVEYKKEAFNMFSELGDRIASETVSKLYHVRITREDEPQSHGTEASPAAKPLPSRTTLPVSQPRNIALNRGESAVKATTAPVTHGNKVGRNDPCPCGSGKKYKKCCGMSA